MTFKEFWLKFRVPEVHMSAVQWEILRTVAMKAFNAGRAAQRKEFMERGRK